MEGVGKLVLLTTCQTLCARKYKKQKKPHNGWIITFVLPVQSAANNKIVCVVIPGKMLLFILPRVLHWALQEYRCKGQGSHSKGLFPPFGKINQSKLFQGLCGISEHTVYWGMTVVFRCQFWNQNFRELLRKWLVNKHWRYLSWGLQRAGPASELDEIACRIFPDRFSEVSKDIGSTEPSH